MNFKTCVLASLAFCCFFLSSISCIKAQSAKTKGDTIELTETDFARLSSFNGSHATFFGIRLGMGRSQVQEKIKNYLYLRTKEDPFNPKRLYLNDMSSDTGAVTIAYLKWPNYDSGLYQIIIYPTAAKYLVGLSQSILTPFCVDSSSEIFQKFLGKPSGSQVTLDLPDIKAKTTQLFYPKQNIVIEENLSQSGNSYYLMLTHKW
jgi:hypothetical protein